MWGRARERGGDVQGCDGGLRRADVVGLPSGAEPGFNAVQGLIVGLCQGTACDCAAGGCAGAMYGTALRRGVPEGRVGRRGGRRRGTEQLLGVAGRGGRLLGA